MTCKRCGIHTPRLTLTQRYCPVCERETTPMPEPKWSAPWLRRLQAKDFTGKAA